MPSKPYPYDPDHNCNQWRRGGVYDRRRRRPNACIECHRFNELQRYWQRMLDKYWDDQRRKNASVYRMRSYYKAQLARYVDEKSA